MWKSTFIILAVFAAVLLAIIVWDVFKGRRKNTRYRLRSSVTSYLMLLPAALLAFLFIMLPILYSLGYAFTDYYLLKPDDIHFIGFDNFAEIWQELVSKGTIYHAILNTLFFVVGVVPLQIGMALGLALFCNRKRRGVKIFKVCFFAPVVISLSVTSYLWLQILSPAPTGLLNSLLSVFGAAPHDWLGDPKTAMPSIIVLSAWQGAGYQMLIFSAGLSNVREDLYEAAALDGAGSWKKFTDRKSTRLNSSHSLSLHDALPIYDGLPTAYGDAQLLYVHKRLFRPMGGAVVGGRARNDDLHRRDNACAAQSVQGESVIWIRRENPIKCLPSRGTCAALYWR